MDRNVLVFPSKIKSKYHEIIFTASRRTKVPGRIIFPIVSIINWRLLAS